MGRYGAALWGCNVPLSLRAASALPPHISSQLLPGAPPGDGPALPHTFPHSPPRCGAERAAMVRAACGAQVGPMGRQGVL